MNELDDGIMRLSEIIEGLEKENVILKLQIELILKAFSGSDDCPCPGSIGLTEDDCIEFPDCGECWRKSLNESQLKPSQPYPTNGQA